MSAFLAMDGYAGFVWSSYGLTVIGSVGLIVWAVGARRAAAARLARLQALEQGETDATEVEP